MITQKFELRTPPRHRARKPPTGNPPPPPTTVHVVAVFPAPGEPTVATWVFDVDVDDPTATVIGFVVDGHGGIGAVRDDANAFRINHGTLVEPGMAWSNTA